MQETYNLTRKPSSKVKGSSLMKLPDVTAHPASVPVLPRDS